MPFLTYLGSGMLLGLAAGMAPGPLFALVISETMRGGLKDGVQVSLAPLLTDLPLAVLATLLFSQVVQLDAVLGVVSIIGAVVLLYYAWENVTLSSVAVAGTKSRRAFVKGVLTNIFNPHVYVSYFTFGGAMIVHAMQEKAVFGAVFVLSFVLTMVLSKIALACITHHSKRFITGRGYIYTVRVLGVALALFALHLLYKGVLFLR